MGSIPSGVDLRLLRCLLLKDYGLSRKRLDADQFARAKAKFSESCLSTRFIEFIQCFQKSIAIDVMLAACVIHGVTARDRTANAPHLEFENDPGTTEPSTLNSESQRAPGRAPQLGDS
jgi:hypothetical protein